MSKNDLLTVEDLAVSFPTTDGRMRVLDGVSFPIYENEILGLVGESGSGKTVTALSIMRLLGPTARVEGGKVWFKGEELLAKGQEEIVKIRGSQISMIFQSPRASLNPLRKVGEQVARAYRLHEGLSRSQARDHALATLSKVGLPDAARHGESYPHQLSTGMCQRVMIAMMVACQPDLLIADEPTTALDPTIAGQIYELLKEIQSETKMSILLITHDFGLVAENCQRVAVMHAGLIVEMADVEAIFADHRHPYTARLLRYLLRVDREVILPPGRATVVEEIDYASSTCRYARKCEEVESICLERRPEMLEVAPGHWVMCHLIA